MAVVDGQNQQFHKNSILLGINVYTYVYTKDLGGAIMEEKKREGVVSVTTTVQRWGNSLAVRIPTRIAEAISMEQGTEIELTVGKTGVMLKPKNNKPSLDDLLARITPENRHSEVDFGREGNELF
ncbi:AbrB/MazE/SpoVT family DNA-binding domain-containing protein [Bacillus sp. FSL M8-0256]|uniref:AbrB/MazE/SpoVT family DNA-binding domain-containing protein n=2 Tax=Bacillus TaxID=1386 RepID=UPI0030F4F1E6